MFKRTRDVKRNFKPLQKVSFQEWEDIQDKAIYAKKFFDKKNIVYLRMQESLDEAINIITENRVHEVREEHTISETFKKVFITPKKIQDDELVGQVKFIKNLFAELQSFIDIKEDIEKKEAEGSIIIERNPEKGK
jgi:predicted DNA-binding antitoxin AbrB/MazE fold protein